MATRKTIILANQSKEIVSFRVRTSYVHGTPADGLWLDDDTMPLTSTMNGGYAELYDHDFYTPVPNMIESPTPSPPSPIRQFMDAETIRPTGIPWEFEPIATTYTAGGSSTDKYSVGLYFSTATTVRMISLWDNGVAGAGVYQNISGLNIGLNVYKSDDGSTWTLIERFNPVNRYAVLMPTTEYDATVSPVSISPVATTTAYRIDMLFNEAHSAKYFKLHAYNGGLKSASGVYLNLSEMKCWVDPDTTTIDLSEPLQDNINEIQLIHEYDTVADEYDTVSQTEKQTIER